MNTCRACADAETNPLSGSYSARCSECQARSIAAGPVYFASLRAKTMTAEYRAVLERVFAESWAVGNERVRHWYQRISKFKREAKKVEPA